MTDCADLMQPVELTGKVSVAATGLRAHLSVFAKFSVRTSVKYLSSAQYGSAGPFPVAVYDMLP